MSNGPFQTSLDGLIQTLENLRVLESDVENAVTLIEEALVNGNKLLVCGNGGSAADSSHFTSEIVGRFKNNRPSFPAICLTTDPATVTGIANDYGYDEVFARQVEGFGQRGDVLVVFSSSGNSQNLLRALEVAQDLEMDSVAILGRDGGITAGLATVDLIVPGDLTARIQEAQKFLLHSICEQLEDALAGELPKDVD